ncbi:DET1- and DDB1-associated protein 1-like [Xenia sp. Carnegie-2017]|uniref:DET1- and DDB1-associated protein 1-like n=1 Tax=Xenia sp. Carnegie-2017 TaxID=2897299 RepID=UPI001F0461AE|nr:DET1- and DDB1-associated protein 1-like [Xenia sp. Carnegie-2017]
MANVFLKQLPSFNEQNFSKFKGNSSIKNSHYRPTVYVPTKDSTDQAVIVTDKANILLRSLHQQLENKLQRKRDSTRDRSPASDYKPSPKVARRMDVAE